ncbi:transposase family protein [Phytohabitans sp. LJ34]|uniref:transposase family protein n=1 Tax=Phytohabitans sp. LJ34 TaxID=3452217 RepID=UPI003F8B835C
MSIVELLAVLFPHLSGLRITNVLAKGPTVRVHAESGSVAARCPDCSTVSRRVHSRYERWLLDTPVAGRETVLHLRVRRFFCILADCVRRIFAEQIDGVTARHGRFSALARQGMEAVALALGGRAGSRLADRLGPSEGRMTLRSAPAAVQVADRWHLLHNLSDAVNRRLAHHRRCLQPPLEQPAPAEPALTAEPAPEGLRQQRTRTRHADVHALREQGVGVYTIARRLGLDPKTVRRYADAATPEDLLGPTAPPGTASSTRSSPTCTNASRKA